MTRATFSRALTRKLVRVGTLRREKCEVCGRGPRYVLAHHDSYRRPSDVRWLCNSCHTKWHIANGPGEGRDEPREVSGGPRAPRRPQPPHYRCSICGNHGHNKTTCENMGAA